MIVLSPFIDICIVILSISCIIVSIYALVRELYNYFLFKINKKDNRWLKLVMKLVKAF